MKILGVNTLHDSTVAWVEDGEEMSLKKKGVEDQNTGRGSDVMIKLNS